MFRTWERNGFTLVELLVVIAILALLISVVLFSVSGAREKARDNVRKTDLAQIQLAIRLHSEAGGSSLADGQICADCSSDVNTAVQTYAGIIEDPKHDGTNYFYEYDSSAGEVCAQTYESTGAPFCVDIR